MGPSRSQVLRLYKDLLRYGEVLTLTDKEYFKRRIREEFKKNIETDLDDLSFLYEVERSSSAEKQEYCLTMLTRAVFNRTQNLFKACTTKTHPQRSKVTIDRSKVPVLNECDLEEQFIRGSGPGGQKLNKTNSCVYLLHKPSGISVKVQESRDQAQNRKKAREKIITMLDNLYNKEDSVENQRKRILKEKSIKNAQKNRKVSEMKENWKKIIAEFKDNKVD